MKGSRGRFSSSIAPGSMSGLRRGLGNSVPRRWLVLAAAGRRSAEAYVLAHGIDARLVLEKHDLLAPPRRLRRLARDQAIDGLIVHSANWSRQRSPQVFEVALALIPAQERFLVEEELGLVHRVRPLHLAARLARMPADPIWDAVVIAAEAGRMSLGRSRAELTKRRDHGKSSAVLALWPGSSATFGGSLTHIEGILGGFREQGV